MQAYTRESSGIPSLSGSCSWEEDDDELVSTLSVDGSPVIEAEASVGDELFDLPEAEIGASVFAVAFVRSTAGDCVSVRVSVSGVSDGACVPTACLYHRHHESSGRRTMGSVTRSIASCGAVRSGP